MEKTSIVKQAKYLNKTWSNDRGTYHVHGIAFENGDFGEYSSISDNQDKFVVGQSATYEMTGSPGRHKIKPVYNKDFEPSKPAFKKEGGEDRSRSFALSYAKDLFMNVEGPPDVGAILEVAQSFVDWLNLKPVETTAGIPDDKFNSNKHNEDQFDPSDVLPF